MASVRSRRLCGSDAVAPRCACGDRRPVPTNPGNHSACSSRAVRLRASSARRFCERRGCGHPVHGGSADMCASLTGPAQAPENPARADAAQARNAPCARLRIAATKPVDHVTSMITGDNRHGARRHLAVAKVAKACGLLVLALVACIISCAGTQESNGMDARARQQGRRVRRQSDRGSSPCSPRLPARSSPSSVASWMPAIATASSSMSSSSSFSSSHSIASASASGSSSGEAEAAGTAGVAAPPGNPQHAP
eukprot:7389670-Prymnesium_polylepis.1